MNLIQKFLKTILPKGLGDDMEAASRRLMLRCPDGHEISLWDAGGARFGAWGKPKKLFPCRPCGRIRWMAIIDPQNP